MRKKMFAAYLEQTKAMVRTNHVELYEPVQLLHDHETIENMHEDTLKALEKKCSSFHYSQCRTFEALRRTKKMEYEEAIDDLKIALNLTTSEKRYKWQMYYRLALLHEALEEYQGGESHQRRLPGRVFQRDFIGKAQIGAKVGNSKVVSARLVKRHPRIGNLKKKCTISTKERWLGNC